MLRAFSIHHAALAVLVTIGCLRPAHSAEPCVLLRNTNVLFGGAQQRGEFVIVRRDDGSELQLNRQDVLCWAGSIRDLYRYRVDHRRVGDVPAMLDDVRWCLRYDLFDLAERELQAIQQIDPQNEMAVRLRDQLRRSIVAKSAPPAPADPTMPVVDTSAVQLAAHEEPELNQEIDTPMLQSFTRHIQPILLNRCGNCHSHNSDRQWTIFVPTTGSRPSGRMAKANLVATLPFIDTDSPENSELRVRAVDGHAGKAGNLGSKYGSALRAVDQWLQISSQRQSVQPLTQVAVTVHQQNAEATASETEIDEPVAASTDQPPGIKRLPTVDNLFDPELFNKQLPRRKRR